MKMKAVLEEWIAKKEGCELSCREDLDALMLKKLNSVLKQEKEKNGFYADLPLSLNSLSEIENLPVTYPQDVIKYYSSIILSSSSKAKRVVSDYTSGTTGEKKRVFYSEEDLSDALGFLTAGFDVFLSQDENVLVDFPFSAENGLTDLVNKAVKRAGGTAYVSGGDKTYEELICLINENNITVYVGSAVRLISLLRMSKKLKITTAVPSGDTLTNGMKKILTEQYDIALYPHYGSREMCFGGASTCVMRSGMHIRESDVIVEITDDDFKRVDDGEYGNVLITTVGMRIFPLIRYVTGDRAMFLTEPCECGGITKRIDGVYRNTEKIDIALLDEMIFNEAYLIDYDISSKDWFITINATSLSGKGTEQIRQIVKKALPDYDVKVNVTIANTNDKPKYPGKRFVKGITNE